MFDITSLSHAHMIAQVRVRQLAIKDSQNILQQKIVALWRENKESSGQKFASNFQEKLQEMYTSSIDINRSLEKFSVDEIGYPIKTNKTPLQLEMAYQWSQEKEDNLMGHIEQNKLYHDLANTVDLELPRLQSPSKTIFWGNENPSVSSILLASLGSTMGLQQKKMAGAALLYPLYDTRYTLRNIPVSYPFASDKEMWLFGDYQFGGQRYLKSKKSLFGPLDCSEAVANSTHLSEEQQLNFSTSHIRNAFFKTDNEYKYIPITSTYKESLNPELIQSGDIYLMKGHTAIITNIDTKGEIGTIEFTRDIDRKTQKILGGGTYSYNLIEKAKYLDSGSLNQIYILRDSHPPLKESYTYSDLIDKIDNVYYECFENKPKDIPGDWSVFIDKYFWGRDTGSSTNSCCLSLC
ncbi:MAG: RP439 family protein [Chlamydiales bacterium]